MTERACTPNVLVLGLGNFLMSDDGVGVHALRALRAQAPTDILSVEVGTAILRAQHLLESHRRVIAFDALRAGGSPGTIYLTTLDQIANGHPGDSLHNLSLANLAQMSGLDPADVVIVAAEPGVIEIGLDLSPELSAATGQMASAALSIAELWKGTKSAANVVQTALQSRS
jgi:hydrogenase maturation protease